MLQMSGKEDHGGAKHVLGSCLLACDLIVLFSDPLCDANLVSHLGIPNNVESNAERWKKPIVEDGSLHKPLSQMHEFSSWCRSRSTGHAIYGVFYW